MKYLKYTSVLFLILLFTFISFADKAVAQVCDSVSEAGQCTDNVDNDGDGMTDGQDTMNCNVPVINNVSCSIDTIPGAGDFNALNLSITADVTNAGSCTSDVNNFIITNDNSGSDTNFNLFQDMFVSGIYTITGGILTDLPLPATLSGEFSCTGQDGTIIASVPMNCTTVTPCNNDGRCTVFLTSDDFPGDFGGLQGGDDLCQNRAQAAGLGGTYRAWVSSSSDPDNGPNNRFNQNSFPYVLTNGNRVANNFAELTSMDLINPIDVDENEENVDGSDINSVWSNTLRNGSISQSDGTADCQNWNTTTFFGAVGLFTETDETWADSSDILGTPLFTRCENPNRLYCFEQ